MKYINYSIQKIFGRYSIDLYEVLCKELNFNKMIELYKLIKHKMEFLDDEPRNEKCCIDLIHYD